MTEKEIVYSIIETLNNYEYNNDNKLGERVVRNFLYTYRGEQLRKYYKDGESISDECYQMIPLKFKKTSSGSFQAKSPAIIEFGNRQGFFVMKYGISIPIVNNTTYAMASEDDLPLAQRLGTTINLKIPTSINSCVDIGSKNRIMYDSLKTESVNGEITADIQAVLVNPSDDPNYNWLRDVFPFPAEKLDELKTTILRKEFGIASQIKSDEVQNARVDNVRYHENTNLEQ